MATTQTFERRQKRLTKNEAMRQRNKEKAKMNALRPPVFMPTIVMWGKKPEGIR